MSEASESPEIRRKRLAKERQASLRKRRKIVNDENCPPETRLRPRQEVEPSGIRQNCLPKENQVCSRKRQNVNITSERIIINNGIKRNDLG